MIRNAGRSSLRRSGCFGGLLAATILGFMLMHLDVAGQDGGGPDSFGYKYDDLVVGAFYAGAWDSNIDLPDDRMSQAVSIGFPFYWYGVPYTQLYVSSNGFITFLRETEDNPEPDLGSGNAIIAAMWDDLVPEATGSIRYRLDDPGGGAPRRFILEYNAIRHFGELPADTSTFQLHLIEFQTAFPRDIPSVVEIHIQTAGADATVGFEDHLGVDNTEISSAPSDGDAWRIYLATNKTPVAVDDEYETLAETALPIADPGVLTNDTDGNGDGLTATLVTSPTNGVLTGGILNVTGGFTYTPNPGFVGVDSFTYTATDGLLTSEAATVTIRVSSVIAFDDPDTGSPTDYTILEDATLVTNAGGTPPGVLDNDRVYPLAGPKDVLSFTQPVNGVVVMDKATGSFTYTPAQDFNGTDTFTYRATNGTAVSDVATVVITVNPINDPPVAVDDSAETAMSLPVLIDVLTNDTDVEGDTLSVVEIPTPPTNGTVEVDIDGIITYTPDGGFFGTDTFIYRITDGGANDEATVTVEVSSNEPPVGVADSYTTAENTTLSVTSTLGVLANDTDADGDQLTAVVETNVTNGTLQLNEDGSFTYTPALGFTGDDIFTYRVSDAEVSVGPVTVTIAVVAQNSLPVAVISNTSPIQGATPLLVTFDGAQSSDPDGTIVTWHWDFGDGSAPVDTTTATVQHTYTTDGTYNATLYVTDNDGIDSATVAVEVQAGSVTGTLTGAQVLAKRNRDGRWKISIKATNFNDGSGGPVLPISTIRVSIGNELIQIPPQAITVKGKTDASSSYVYQKKKLLIAALKRFMIKNKKGMLLIKTTDVIDSGLPEVGDVPDTAMLTIIMEFPVNGGSILQQITANLTKRGKSTLKNF